MEKRIPFYHFQSVRAVAKAIDPHLRTLETLKKKVVAIKEEYEEKMARLNTDFDEKTAKIKIEFDAEVAQINALESGILQVTGFHVNDLVKKVIEPTGKTDAKTGKPLKTTKYVPTDIVKYDETTKEFVISVDEEEPECPNHEEPVAEEPEQSSTEETTEVNEEEETEAAVETEDENNQMPWE